MSAIAEHAIKQYRLPLWALITLSVGTGIGVAAVSIIIALIGVAAALAGNTSLPEIIR